MDNISPSKYRESYSWKWRRFKIKLLNWEYWPVYIFNIPVVMTWLWFAMRNRDLFFFALTNPGIKTGGFFGESKSETLMHIPEAYRPKTILWQAPIKEEVVAELFQQSGLQFPIIAKPKIGERGWLVSPIHSLDELKNYLRSHPIDFILQPFLEMPMEVSIMVHQSPDGSQGKVSSICQKEFLHVVGDGISTLEELILDSDRAFLQINKLRGKLGVRMQEVPAKGEYLLLEPVGNHCRGTKFINRNDQSDDAIRAVMVDLLRTMPEVNYGRFDMKITSWDELRQGRGIQILEFNGTSSDPAHIYDPGYSLLKAYKDIAYHWGVMAAISMANRRAGKKRKTFKKIIVDLILYFRYKRTNN